MVSIRTISQTLTLIQRKTFVQDKNTGLSKTACETLRRLRVNKGLTQAEVAKQTELSVSYINQIEKGHRTPSLTTLQTKIAPVYGIANIFHILEKREAPEKPMVVIKQGTYLEPLKLERSHKLIYKVLTDEKVEKEQLHVSFVTLSKKSDSGDSQHQGNEVIYVIEGSIEVIVGNERNFLSKGDLVHFNSEYTHRMRNTEKKDAKMLIVRTPAY